VGRAHPGESLRRGFRLIAGRADVEHVGEQVRQAQPLQHAPGVDVVGIGEDQPAPRQPLQRRQQVGVVRQGLQRHVVEDGVEVLRVDAVVQHHPLQRQAVLGQVGLLQPERLFPRQAGDPLHEVGHPAHDGLHEPGLRRVEGVVQVEQPGVDMAQVGGHCPHLLSPHTKWEGRG
jgi:hypothetical protein